MANKVNEENVEEYTPEEIKLLDSFGVLSEGLLDDDELYEIIWKNNFNKERITNEIKELVSKMKRKGEDYLWAEISHGKKKKEEPKQELNTNTKKAGNDQRTQKADYKKKIRSGYKKNYTTDKQELDGFAEGDYYPQTSYNTYEKYNTYGKNDYGNAEYDSYSTAYDRYSKGYGNYYKKGQNYTKVKIVEQGLDEPVRDEANEGKDTKGYNTNKVETVIKSNKPQYETPDNDQYDPYSQRDQSQYEVKKYGKYQYNSQPNNYSSTGNSNYNKGGKYKNWSREGYKVKTVELEENTRIVKLEEPVQVDKAEVYQEVIVKKEKIDKQVTNVAKGKPEVNDKQEKPVQYSQKKGYIGTIFDYEEQTAPEKDILKIKEDPVSKFFEENFDIDGKTKKESQVPAQSQGQSKQEKSVTTKEVKTETVKKPNSQFEISNSSKNKFEVVPSFSTSKENSFNIIQTPVTTGSTSNTTTNTNSVPNFYNSSNTNKFNIKDSKEGTENTGNLKTSYPYNQTPFTNPMGMNSMNPMMSMGFPQGNEIPNQQQMMMNPYMFMNPYYMMMMQQQMQGDPDKRQNYGMDTSKSYMNFPNPQQMMMYQNMMNQVYFPGMSNEEMSKNMGSNMYNPNGY